jgi:hypothetical protein
MGVFHTLVNKKIFAHIPGKDFSDRGPIAAEQAPACASAAQSVSLHLGRTSGAGPSLRSSAKLNCQAEAFATTPRLTC